MYAKVHVVTPIAKVYLVTPISKVHLVTPLYTDDVNYSLITRRPAKFRGIPSSRSGDIKDFSKSKMAAVPPFGSSSKVKTHREHICSLNATTCKIR